MTEVLEYSTMKLCLYLVAGAVPAEADAGEGAETAATVREPDPEGVSTCGSRQRRQFLFVSLVNLVHTGRRQSAPAIPGAETAQRTEDSGLGTYRLGPQLST